MRYLLDTDTCIDLLRGKQSVIKRIQNVAPDDCAVSVISSFELCAGAARVRDPSREREKVERFIGAMVELAFDQGAAREAAALRHQLEQAGTPVGPYDLLIAAQARSLKLILVSANTAEFARVSGLQLENWR